MVQYPPPFFPVSSGFPVSANATSQSDDPGETKGPFLREEYTWHCSGPTS